MAIYRQMFRNSQTQRAYYIEFEAKSDSEAKLIGAIADNAIKAAMLAGGGSISAHEKKELVEHPGKARVVM